MPHDRHIPLAGASNFRDFGGYPTTDGRSVKWGLLFRSDRLSELTAADFERLADLGIRQVHDLRRASEVALAPTRWPGSDAPALIASPLFEDEAGPSTFHRVAADEAARHDPAASRAIMAETYVRMITEPGPLAAFRRMFSALAEPGAFPVLIHCSGGKDRTGVTCALLQSVLGVSRRDVTHDFMLTQQYYSAAANLRQRVSQIVSGAELGFWSEAALAPIFGVEQLYIDTVLDRIAAGGGVEAFLIERVGLEPRVLARLREALLD
jgi:protein-tyrosine phosphatase